jgi:poly(3-hydroxyalkanoate) synthetase
MTTSFSNYLFWPLATAAASSRAAADYLDVLSSLLNEPDRDEIEPPSWTTANKVALELPTMRLRDFSTWATGSMTLICAPYALHEATIADFAPEHSLVEALHQNGINRLAVTEWRTASPEMGRFSIDTYLAELNVAVDSLGAAVDLIGLCQGGWMALLYAARFPDKVRRLVLVGAPIDIEAAPSKLSRLARELPYSAYEKLVELGGGRVRGRHMLQHWAPALAAADLDAVLQLPAEINSSVKQAIAQRFAAWYGRTVDLPGTYYLQVARELFLENRIARGSFVALGRRIDLRRLRIPVYLLAARDDDLVAPQQLLAAEQLLGTPPALRNAAIERCGHLALFLGRRVLGQRWRQVAEWLRGDVALKSAS